MCFIEFVGYTCGHTSMPVLRPCPLTTASHTFPTCTRRGDKTFFAGEMCSACQKIVHSRATQIEEYEHRFMHERGVCGCETVFPYLIRPRVIGSCGGSVGGGVAEPGGTITNCDGQGHGHDLGGHGGHGTDAEPMEIQLPPLLCEATDPGGRTMVSVRLPSLYAAEWVADHRARHEAGLCHCRIDFRTYQEVIGQNSATTEANLEAGVVAVAAAAAVAVDSNVGPARAHRRAASMSAMSLSGDSSGQLAIPDRQITRSSSHEDFSSSVDVAGEPSSNDIEGTATAEDALDSKQLNQIPQESGFAISHAPIPPFPSKTVRYAGSVFAEVPEYLQLMGPFLSQPSMQAQGVDQQPMMLDCVLDDNGGSLTMVGGGEQGQQQQQQQQQQQGHVGYIGRPEYGQNQIYTAPRQQSRRRPRAHTMADIKAHHEHQARQQTPLVGFPIGAGPEGVSHAIPWRNRPPCWRRS